MVGDNGDTCRGHRGAAVRGHRAQHRRRTHRHSRPQQIDKDVMENRAWLRTESNQVATRFTRSIAANEHSILIEEHGGGATPKANGTSGPPKISRIDSAQASCMAARRAGDLGGWWRIPPFNFKRSWTETAERRRDACRPQQRRNGTVNPFRFTAHVQLLPWPCSHAAGDWLGGALVGHSFSRHVQLTGVSASTLCIPESRHGTGASRPKPRVTAQKTPHLSTGGCGTCDGDRPEAGSRRQTRQRSCN